MFTQYVDAALRHARCRQFDEDKTFYCEIPACPGVWANTGTLDEALTELREVLEGWILLGLQQNDPFPVIDGGQ